MINYLISAILLTLAIYCHSRYGAYLAHYHYEHLVKKQKHDEIAVLALGMFCAFIITFSAAIILTTLELLK